MMKTYDVAPGAYFPDLSNLKVIVVDDLAFSRTLARSLLVAAGVRHVEMAAGVEEGWRLLCSTRPDLLVLDWELAEQSGIDLLRRIRDSNESQNPSLPVLMLTAYREELRVRQAILAGISAYLTKPFTPRDFILKVKFCVENRSSSGRRPYYIEPSNSEPMFDGRLAVD